MKIYQTKSKQFAVSSTSAVFAAWKSDAGRISSLFNICSLAKKFVIFVKLCHNEFEWVKMCQNQSKWGWVEFASSITYVALQKNESNLSKWVKRSLNESNWVKMSLKVSKRLKTRKMSQMSWSKTKRVGS